eukprot:3383994-Rhodomonas_salina.1
MARILPPSYRPMCLLLSSYASATIILCHCHRSRLLLSSYESATIALRICYGKSGRDLDMNHASPPGVLG